MSWPVVTLADVASHEPKAITDGPFGSNLARRHYTASGPRVIRLQNIGDGYFVNEQAHVSEEHFARLQNHEVKAGDLLIASLGEVLPRGCLAPDWLGPAIVKADCIRVRLGDRVDPRWVLYSLQRPSVRRWADDHRHGVGRPRLGLGTIRQIPVPLPPLSEQRRIVEILEDHLSRLQAARVGLARASARAEALERSGLQCHFGLTGQGVQLGDLVTGIGGGKSFGSANVPAGPDEWGIIKVSAMTWGEFRADENKAVPAERVDPRYEIHAGDLLVSRANTAEYVGASVLVGTVRPRLLLSDKSLRVTPRDGVCTEWLWRALQAPSARRQLSAMATGTKESMRNISQAALRAVKLPHHDAEEQETALRDFEHIRASTDELKRHLGQQTARTRTLRRALLAAAFSGDLTGRSAICDLAEEMTSA